MIIRIEACLPIKSRALVSTKAPPRHLLHSLQSISSPATVWLRQAHCCSSTERAPCLTPPAWSLTFEPLSTDIITQQHMESSTSSAICACVFSFTTISTSSSRLRSRLYYAQMCMNIQNRSTQISYDSNNFTNFSLHYNSPFG